MKKESHEGYLYIKSGVLKLQKEKYFILEGNQLSYKNKQNSKKTKKIVLLDKDTSINYHPSYNNDIITIEKGKKKFELTANDKKQLCEWLLDLRSATFCNNSLSMDSFNIISVIGRGFYGKVMLVSSKKNNKLYALKTVHKSVLIRSGRIQTVLAERAILGMIDNPFIEKMRFAFQTATKFYFGLEYIHGGDLMSLMQKQIPLHDIKVYISEIAEALNFLHSKGILYRDLKPENVLIANDGHLKLIDFGLSKVISGTNSTKTFCGTTDFLAPEMILLKTYSYEIDWWALGILAYEMIFHKNPFHDDNKDKFYNNVINSNPVYPKDADPICVDFLNHLLDKDSKKRYKFKQLVNHDFLKEINHNDLINKKYKVAFIPQLKKDDDLRYCDQDCLAEPAVDSIATCPLEDQRFQGFSFSNLEFNP